MTALLIFGGLWFCLSGVIVCAYVVVREGLRRRDEWAAARQHAAQMRALAPAARR